MRSRPMLALIAVLMTFTFALAAAGCGPANAGPGSANGPSDSIAKHASDGGAATDGASADAGPPPKPFAGSASEATQLIGVAVDKNAAQVEKCVSEYRTRKKLPHERVTISMGIDQEGRLLGATLPKGKADETLSSCVQAALANAPFPRSHSGVISISKSYEEVLQ